MMNRVLRMLDLVGLAILICALFTYSIWSVQNTFLWVVTGVGILCVLIGFWAKREELGRSLRRRSTVFGLNSFVFIIVLVGILGLINYLGQRYDKRVDTTRSKTFSLSDQTTKILNGMNKKVHIKAFFLGGENPLAKDLLIEYRSRSHNKIDFQFIDPDKQPQLAKKYDVRVYGDDRDPLTGNVYHYGTLVLEANGSVEKIEKQREELKEVDLTNALLKVTKSETKTVYFLTGHGEVGIDNRERTGYHLVKEALQKERFDVKPLNLVQERILPDNATVLVIAGPTREPFDEEFKLIEDYLNRGGSGFVLLDPPPAAGLKPFLKNWSVEVGDNVVVDRLSRIFGGGPTVPLVTKYGRHPITERLNASGVMTFFPMARSVTPIPNANPNVMVEKLIETNPFPNSWAIRELTEPIRFDPAKDMKGPITLGVACVKELSEKGKEEVKKKARLVVFGNSAFANNQFFVQQGNGDLFLNAVNWLAQEESLISIRPKMPQDRRILLSESQRRVLFFVIFLLIPSSILVIGIAVWAKRRQ